MEIKKINLQDKTFLTTDEVANLLRVKSNTVKKWRSRGIGPNYYKFGGAVRYCKFEILKKIKNER
jgi:hypothetical protein